MQYLVYKHSWAVLIILIVLIINWETSSCTADIFFFLCQEHVFFVSIIELFNHAQSARCPPVVPCSSHPSVQCAMMKCGASLVNSTWERSQEESHTFCPGWLLWSGAAVKFCQQLPSPDSTGNSIPSSPLNRRTTGDVSLECREQRRRSSEQREEKAGSQMQP